jgi:hypothetical protein
MSEAKTCRSSSATIATEKAASTMQSILNLRREQKRTEERR